MRSTGWLALAAAGLIGLAAPVAAQRGPVGPRGPAPDGGPGMRAGVGVERILALRDDLELTEAQVAALNEIRSQVLEQRQAEVAFMMGLRSDLQAGEITRAQMREALEERREARTGQAEAGRDRVRSILSEEQLDALAERGRRQARRSGVRGRRPGAGFGPGRPGAFRGGRGFGPSMRFRRGGPGPIARGFMPRGGVWRR